jgi:glyoxylase-like metal-dependent hydrolase (beta-lactamase superfamily II)
MISPLRELGAPDLIEIDRDFTPQIGLPHTPGHMPGQLSTLVTSGGERVLIWGDVVIHPAQVSQPEWNVMFDMDGETARQSSKFGSRSGASGTNTTPSANVLPGVPAGSA